MIRPSPIISTSGPPNTIARVKPQKAVPTIHPTCVFVRLNSPAQIPSTKEPRVAKASAVTTSATQLALKSCVFFIDVSMEQLVKFQSTSLKGSEFIFQMLSQKQY